MIKFIALTASTLQTLSKNQPSPASESAIKQDLLFWYGNILNTLGFNLDKSKIRETHKALTTQTKKISVT